MSLVIIRKPSLTPRAIPLQLRKKGVRPKGSVGLRWELSRRTNLCEAAEDIKTKRELKRELKRDNPKRENPQRENPQRDSPKRDNPEKDKITEV